MYAAYIENLPTPIAMAETKSRCLEIALHHIVTLSVDPVYGQTCRELLDGELGDINSPKLRIAEFTIS